MKKGIIVLAVISLTSSNYGMVRTKRFDKPQHALNKLNLQTFKGTNRLFSSLQEKTQERILLEEKAAPKLWNTYASQSLKKVLVSEERNYTIFCNPHFSTKDNKLVASWEKIVPDEEDFYHAYKYKYTWPLEKELYSKHTYELKLKTKNKANQETSLKPPTLLDTLKSIIGYKEEQDDDINFFTAVSTDLKQALIQQYGTCRLHPEPLHPEHNIVELVDEIHIVDLESKSILDRWLPPRDHQGAIQKAQFSPSNSFVFLLKEPNNLSFLSQDCRMAYYFDGWEGNNALDLDGQLRDIAISPDGQHILALVYNEKSQKEEAVWYRIDYITDELSDEYLKHITTVDNVKFLTFTFERQRQNPNIQNKYKEAYKLFSEFQEDIKRIEYLRPTIGGKKIHVCAETAPVIAYIHHLLEKKKNQEIKDLALKRRKYETKK